MQDACDSNVPWLKNDTTETAPPAGPESGKYLVERIKFRLGELSKEGKMKEDGLYFHWI